MSAPAVGCEILFELDAGLATGRRPLAQHLQNGAFLLRAIFRSVLDLQVELDFWRVHRNGVSADCRINESPSSSVRIGVLSSAQALELSSETSLGRGARSGAAAADCATT